MISKTYTRSNGSTFTITAGTIEEVEVAYQNQVAYDAKFQSLFEGTEAEIADFPEFVEESPAKEATTNGEANMYGYIADHNYGTTLVLSNGRVFEKREQPGGGHEWYLVEEGVEPDTYTTDLDEKHGKSDWRMLQDEEEISRHIDLEEADYYYIGEKPRNHR